MSKKALSLVNGQPPTFDFEALYKTYPRKPDGKKRGMMKLQQIIKTPEQYEAFKVALSNFVAQMKKEGREKHYIMQWPTFVNNYEDYLEVETEEIYEEF